jgi:hypothetical protein
LELLAAAVSIADITIEMQIDGKSGGADVEAFFFVAAYMTAFVSASGKSQLARPNRAVLTCAPSGVVRTQAKRTSRLTAKTEIGSTLLS